MNVRCRQRTVYGMVRGKELSNRSADRKGFGAERDCLIAWDNVARGAQRVKKVRASYNRIHVYKWRSRHRNKHPPPA